MLRAIAFSALLLAGCAKHGTPGTPGGGPSDAIAPLVIADLGSPAFGGQHVAASCVSVAPPAAAGSSTVTAARVRVGPGCADQTAAELLWIYVRRGSGGWDEQFMGPAPKCWKGVPADIASAVAQVSKIPACAP